MPSSAGEISLLLTAMKGGDPAAQARLIALVYDDLHARAERYMSRERRDHTLQPTALVNETYLRLLADCAIDWHGRAHFFAMASTVMREVLVDHARKRKSGKRTGGRRRVDLDAVMACTQPKIEQLVILDEYLTRLAEWGPRHARLVEMKYFGGLTDEEAADVLNVSVRTVKRDWRAARAWLQSELSRPRE